MRKTILIIIMMAAILLIPTAQSDDYWNFLTEARGNNLYCRINGDCTLNNLTVVGSYINVTVVDYNVSGTISTNGTIKAGLFEGNNTQWNLTADTNLTPYANTYTVLNPYGATFGSGANIAKFSRFGDLELKGVADYLVDSNDYAFRSVTSANVGLYFALSPNRYEFRDTSANSAFTIFLDGDSNVSRNLDVTQNLTVNNTDLFVDTYNARVGIGTNSPEAEVDVRDGEIWITDTNGDFAVKLIKPTAAAWNGGIEWANGSRLVEQETPGFGSVDRMLYYPNGDRFEVLNEAGDTFTAGFHGANSALSNRIYFYDGLVIGDFLAGASTVPPSEGLRVQGDVLLDSELTVTNNTILNKNLTVNNTDLFVDTYNGRVGIGTDSPDASLHINSQAITGREEIIRAKVSDAGNDGFFVSGASVTGGTFIPQFSGFVDSTQKVQSLGFVGMIAAGDDIAGDGGRGVIDFRSSRTSSSTNPVAGVFADLTNRAAFSFRNNANYLMNILANGNVGIGTTTPNSQLTVAGNASINQTFYVNDSRVGIGQSKPQWKLDIRDDETIGLNLETSSGNAWYISDAPAGGNWAGSIMRKGGANKWFFATETGDDFVIAKTTGDIRYRIDSPTGLHSFTGGNVNIADNLTVNNTNLFVNTYNGRVGVRTNSPAQAFTVNQGSTGDGFAVTRESVDYSQPMTDELPADAFFFIRDMGGAAGGSLILTASDDDATAFSFQGMIGATDPTDTTAAVLFEGSKWNGGTSRTRMGAGETAIQFRTYTDPIMTMTSGGSKGSHRVGINTSYPTHSLHVNGSSNLTNDVYVGRNLKVFGDLNVTGNITGNLIFAEMYGENMNEVNIAVQNQYYNITDFNGTELNGFDWDGNNTLTVLVAGRYEMSSGWSFSGSASTEYHIAIGVNGSRIPLKCHGERVIGTGADVGYAGTPPCTHNLKTDDRITLMIENKDSTTDPTPKSVGFVLKRIGD